MFMKYFAILTKKRCGKWKWPLLYSFELKKTI